MKPFAVTALFAGWTLLASSGPARAANAQHAAHKIAPPHAVMACGPDITLSLPAASASQGGLLLAELVARMSLSDVQMRFDGEEIPSWGVGGSDRSERKLWAWHGLVAVDLEKAAGDYALVLTALQASGEKISCELGVHVTAGKFPTESLKVAPQFVEPNPEQLERAKSEQRRLREIYATRTAEKLWHGKFRAPLDGVTSGANFGRRRVLNGEPSSPHTGVDFPAPTGTPVHAAQAGRVVLAEPLYFSGNTVLIDHGLGVYTLYGHLSQIAVTAGDKLSTGAVLGKVGATGRVTGPHLHWGLTVNRAHVNALGIVNLTGD